jgi:predicted membrane-bound mannosyltransferase
MTMLPLLSNRRFKLDETVLHKGAALHASWALEFLKQSSSEHKFNTGSEAEL